MTKHHNSNTIISIILTTLIFNIELSAQSEYTIKFPAPQAEIFPRHYYISSVIDNRNNKSDNGKILSSTGKLNTVVFDSNIDSSIFQYAGEMVHDDTTLAPVSIIIEKFHFSDAGSISKHTLNLDYKLSVVRFLEGKEIVLYATNGKPSFISTGVTPGLAEKLLKQVLDALINGFEQYANENSEQPSFCRKSESILIYNDEYTNYKDADTIRWKAEYELKWDDFQGQPDPASSFSAQSNCMFSFKSMVEYKSGVMKLSLFLYPCFTKKASWVRSGNKQDGLLQHEQLHFDICELYIRKLRMKISSLNLPITEPGTLIGVEFNEAWKDYQKAQALYDEESQHGIIERVQKRWEDEIKTQLNELAEFTTR